MKEDAELLDPAIYRRRRPRQGPRRLQRLVASL
jgi:hypothetical protein